MWCVAALKKDPELQLRGVIAGSSGHIYRTLVVFSVCRPARKGSGRNSGDCGNLSSREHPIDSFLPLDEPQPSSLLAR